MVSFSTVWKRILKHQGHTFHQKRGKAFRYKIISGAVKPSTTNQQIGKDQFLKAFNLVPLKKVSEANHLWGPSFLYGILMDGRIRKNDW